MNRLLRILSALTLWVTGTDAAPKRSRAETIPGMHASNTAGMGDIWVQTAFTGAFRVKPVPQERFMGLVDTTYARDLIELYGGGSRMGRDMLLYPSLKATVGLAEFLHFEVENVPWDGEKIGASRAGLTLTTPGNDDLRLFGFAVMADATLSTEEDIYSRGETTPGFDPLFHFGAVADLDLIKKWPSLPVKAYLNWSNLADYRLAHAFKQQWAAAAVEWKGYRREYYARLGLSWFKPLPTRFEARPAAVWDGPHAELGLGWRWFFADRFWGNAELSFDPLSPTAFYSDATHRPPKIFVGFDVPLFFQETRAEAVRALIYTEEMRRAARKQAALHPETVAKEDTASAGSTPGLGALRLDELELKSRSGDSTQATLKSLFEDQDEAAAEKRKRVRQELQHIEELLP